MNRVAVLTYGCTHNQKDSQLIEAQLLQNGYKLVPEAEAEIVIVNSCTVKQPTENKIIRKLDDLQQHNREVVVAGCLSQSEPEMIRKRYPNFLVMGVNAAPYIIFELHTHLQLGDVEQHPLIQLPTLDNPKAVVKNTKIRHTPIHEQLFDKPLAASTAWNPHLNIVQINEGCLNNCTYCATKNARGRLQSFSRQSIIRSIREHPTPEVWLTSQDTACFGFDSNDSLPNLLNDIADIQRKLWVRVGMGNPNNFIKILDETVAAYHSDKIYKFLHLPLQAGANSVLKHMRRGYTVEDYLTIVHVFRKAFPQLNLATDIIVGYPTETEEDYQATLNAIAESNPTVTNISRYWKRRGTEAAELPQLPHKVRMVRSKQLASICKEMQLRTNEQYIGWEGEVLINEQGTKGGVKGRNIYYQPIVVRQKLPLGKWYNVRITAAESTYYFAELIKN